MATERYDSDSSTLGDTMKQSFATLLAVALFTVTGCGALGGSDATDSGGNEKVERATVKVGLIPQLIDMAGFQRAKKAGYFADEGITVEEVAIKSATDAVPQLKTNQLDFSIGNWVTFIEAQARGVVDLRIVADGLRAREGMNALVAMPDAGIRTPQDLPGRSIGINALRGNVELTSRAVIQAAGVDPNSVQFKVIPTSNALNALQTKQIDVMSLQEPNLTTAKQKMGVVVVVDRATGPVADFPVGGYVTSAGFAEQNPKTVAAFQRAVAKGQADVADRAVLEETLMSYANIDQNIARNVGVGVFPTTVERSRLQRVADLMRTYGILDEEFDVTPMIYEAT